MVFRFISLLLPIWLIGASTRMNFDREPFGMTPPGWTAAVTNGAPGKWEIRKDETARTQPYVLAQVSNNPQADRLPLAIWNNADLSNADVAVRIKTLSGHEVQSGGLIWRYRDEQNYYQVRADAVQNTVAVYKVVNGRMIRLGAAVKHEIPVNQWRILKVAVRGPGYQVFVDHRRILKGEDSAYTGSGKVGLFTVADSVAYFDDFRVDAK